MVYTSTINTLILTLFHFVSLQTLYWFSQTKLFRQKAPIYKRSSCFQEFILNSSVYFNMWITRTCTHMLHRAIAFLPHPQNSMINWQHALYNCIQSVITNKHVCTFIKNVIIQLVHYAEHTFIVSKPLSRLSTCLYTNVTCIWIYM